MRLTFSSLLLATLAFGAVGCDDPTRPEESTVTHPQAATEPTIRITNLSVRTGRAYRVMPASLGAGAKAYVDRSLTIASPVPTSMQQVTYIETADADRDAYPGSNTLMSFDIDRDADVFVAHDRRTALPNWLKVYRDTGLDLLIGTTRMRLFARRFTVGRVQLGSNVATPEHERMYLVAVNPVTSDASAPPSQGSHAGWYVAVNGTSTNAGTMASPWSLAHALTQPSGVRPGDTIWVRGGTYKQYDWTSKLIGTSSAPIVVRAYPGERAAIETQGMFQIQGSDTWWWGLEWRFSWTTRTSPESGSHPTAIAGPLSTVYVTGPRTKIINSLVHDTGDGVAIWQEAAGSELYGSLVWYTGWQGPDRGHGHAVYTQNGGAQMVYRDNLLWDSYDIGVQAYGGGGVPIRNYLFEGNAIWGHGTLATSGSSSQAQFGGDGNGQDFTIQKNVIYDLLDAASAARFGYNTSVSYYRYTVRDNWFVGGGPTLRIWNLFQSTFVGNTTYNPYCSDGCRMDFLGNRSGWTWSGNSHYGNAGAVDWLYNNAPKTWSSWKSATGLGGSDAYAAGAPPQKVLVRPNAYEKGRANIVVLSFNGASTAVADLSGIGLPVGRGFEVRNAQNYFGTPVLTGTYQGGTITLPLSGLTKAPISGNAPKSPLGTGTRFNAFVVVPK